MAISIELIWQFICCCFACQCRRLLLPLPVCQAEVPWERPKVVVLPVQHAPGAVRHVPQVLGLGAPALDATVGPNPWQVGRESESGSDEDYRYSVTCDSNTETVCRWRCFLTRVVEHLPCEDYSFLTFGTFGMSAFFFGEDRAPCFFLARMKRPAFRREVPPSCEFYSPNWSLPTIRVLYPRQKKQGARYLPKGRVLDPRQKAGCLILAKRRVLDPHQKRGLEKVYAWRVLNPCQKAHAPVCWW